MGRPRYQHPSVLRTKGRRPRWYYRVMVDLLVDGSQAARKEQAIYLGFCDAMGKREAEKIRDQQLEAINTTRPKRVGPASLTRSELKHLRASWPAPTSSAIWREMIRAGLFKDGVVMYELNAVEAAAREILRHKENVVFTERWCITPELIAECERLVDLIASVPWKVRHPGLRTTLQQILDP